jgi:putative aldouronate transport system permease protein
MRQTTSILAKGRRLRVDLWNQRYLFVLLMPGVIWYLIYRYWPMAGLSIAFKEFSFTGGMFGGEWVGLKYFRYIFYEHRNFWDLVRNTFLINVYRIFFYFPVPLILALMINEISKPLTKRVLQTTIYLPHFVSWVVFGSIVLRFLAPNDGIVNWIRSLFGAESIFFMSDPRYFRTIVVVSDIWKQAGWGTIVYLAAITGIDPNLYEAAKIDGASKLASIWHVTLPSIADTIVVLLLLNLGRMMEVGFEQIYVLANPTIYSVGDVISTYVYRIGIGSARFSLTTAIGLFQSIVGFAILVICNLASKRIAGRSLW